MTLRVFALDPAKSIFQFNCQNWTRQNGLPADKINTVAQTRDGYLWLGTQNGLVSFDGQEFKAIPIDLPQAQGQDVRKLFAAKNGAIYFAINNGGFGSYDGKIFSPVGDARWSQQGVYAATIIAARDGAVWTGGNWSVGRWFNENSTGNFFNTTNFGSVISLCEDAAGRIWFGTAEHGLFYWADGKFVQLPDESLKQQNIFSLATDAENQIWVGTGNGLRCYANGQAKEIPTLDYEVKALLVDRHGILWVGTTGMGLARYEHGKFSYLRKTDGLVGDNITSLCEDAEGSLWVGTRDGLSQLSDVKFPIYSEKEGIGQGSSHAVAASKNGGLWIATDVGISFFDGRTATNYDAESLFPNHYTKRCFEARNGDVYVEDGQKNIDVVSGGQLLARFPNSEWPQAFAEDDESVLVTIGAGDSLYRIEDGKLSHYQYQGALRPDYYWINNLCVAKDDAIWVACDNGVFRLQNGTIKHWSTAEGLSGGTAWWICQDVDGSIWAGLNSGIVRIKDGQVKNIQSANGLPDDRIYAIVPDNLGFFWFNCGRGIFRASRQSLNDFADGKTTQVECQLFDGLESVKSIDRTDQESSGCKTLDGRIWFPSPWGVVMIDPAHILTNPIAPPVHIESVLVNGKEFVRNENIIVPPGKGELEIHFAALSFIAPQKIQFRYQLEGYDKDWVQTTGRRAAFYTNLKPGRYTFRVTAANADGVWNKEGDTLKMELRPHFYQTIWCYLLYAVLACAVLAGLYAWRIRHLRARQRALQQARDLLETKVQHRTAELAAANTSLNVEVGERKRTVVELAQRTKSLEHEIEERKQMGLELEEIHKQLLERSRQAGMAEVASNVLHNVGNVLNSVNISASVVADSVKKSRAASLAKVVGLLREHEHDLGAFFTTDSRGRQLPAYLSQLSEHFMDDQKTTVDELELLVKNIAHIKEIVVMQQSYAKVSGLKEIVNLRELIEDSLRMNVGALGRHRVELVREFEDVPPINVEKHKILQILVNLIRNAKHACQDSARADKRLTVRVTDGDHRIKISVIDNGVGIPQENLTRIFNHGFTTRKDGHGFGLHSGAIAAKEMGGSLTVHSAGVGQGATFTLELPCDTNKDSHE